MSVSVLIEGPDGSGKTYLAERLVENLKASYIHGQKVPKKELDLVCERMIQAIELLTANNFNVVTDRFIYSQPIYEQIFEKDDRNDHNHLLKWYARHFDYQIICVPQDREKYLQEFNRIKSFRTEEYSIMTDVYDAYKGLYFGENFGEEKKVQDIVYNDFFLDIVKKGGLRKNKNCFIYDRFTGLLDNGNSRYTIEEFCRKINEEESFTS